MRKLLSLVLLMPLFASAEPAAVYQPLAFLAGHCWKGTFPDGKQTDEHCFSWIYGGKFLRDEHTVRGPGHADMRGESIYFWNSSAGKLEYLYIEDQGGHSRGLVDAAESGTLKFPSTNFEQDGQTQVYRSQWQRVGDNAYEVLTEFQSKDGWVPGFKVHMVRVQK